MGECLKSREIALVGNALAPLFLHSPSDELFNESLSIWFNRSCELEEAWPFGSSDGLSAAFSLIREGAADGVSDGVLAEYRRLIQGPAHLEAPLWGSVYTDRDGVLFGETTVQLMRWIDRSGIDFARGSNEAIDHVGIMLALMAWIAQEKPELLEEFLGEHFFPWVFRYADLLEQSASHPLYRGFAKLLRVTLEGIKDECGICVASLKLYR